MKKRALYYLIGSIFALCISVGAGRVSAQRVGAYGVVSPRIAAVQNAARFAVTARAKATGEHVLLFRVLNAQRQVVAGLNYKLCMRVREGGKNRTVTAVVYQDLKRKRELTSWDIGLCQE